MAKQKEPDLIPGGVWITKYATTRGIEYYPKAEWYYPNHYEKTGERYATVYSDRFGGWRRNITYPERYAFLTEEAAQQDAQKQIAKKLLSLQQKAKEMASKLGSPVKVETFKDKDEE